MSAVVFCMILVLSCAASIVLCAQNTYSITGDVKTDSGRAFPKAVVMADNTMGVTVAVFSRPDGQFVVTGLLPGNYQVSAQQLGYVKVNQTIVIPAAKPVSFVLRPAPADRRNDRTDQIHEAINVGPPARHLLAKMFSREFDIANFSNGETSQTK
jgi:hypothetical protein